MNIKRSRKKCCNYVKIDGRYRWDVRRVLCVDSIAIFPLLFF